MSNLIKLHFNQVETLVGFAASTTGPGQRVVDVLCRDALTSDDAMFHKYMESISSAVLARTNLVLDHIYQFVILLHADGSADAFLNELPICVTMIAKREMKAGETVRINDVVDVLGLRFDGIEIKESDNLICCLKIDWKFGLYFDFGRANDPNSKIDQASLSTSLAAIYRYLRFEEVYRTLEAEKCFTEMQREGWFPFIELIGAEFKNLLELFQAGQAGESQIAELLQHFDAIRIARITGKWWGKTLFKKKQTILQPGINAFLRNDQEGFVLCLKTLLPEIEGLIRLLYFAETGTSPVRLESQTEYFAAKAKGKASSGASLLLPVQFIEYLQSVVFRGFNLASGDVPLSRHSSGHRVAAPEAYTKARALQAILILDQIFFYLSC